MNPLLEYHALPPFDQIELAHFEPALKTLIDENRAQIKKAIDEGADTWETLVYPLEEADARISNAWSVISHYNSVLNSDELREIYKRLIAMLTEFHTEVGQNAELYQAYQRLADSDAFNDLNQAQKQTIKHIIRSFKLSGVALSEDDKKTYAALKQEQSSLSNTFSENVLDATQAWTLYFEDKSSLPGVPDSALQLFESQAKAKGHEKGYLLTLDIPSYLPVMTYCEDRSLREKMYEAYMTRASDQGPNAGEWDNSEIIEQTLAGKQKLAKLLGFNNYAERSLATKMASTTEEVIDFLQQLAEKTKDVAQQEVEELKQFAKTLDGLETLQSWDVAFYSEKLKQEKYNVSQEELKPYFPVSVVVQGMFDVVERLLGVSVRVRDDVETFHPDAKYYSIFDGDEEIAGFYLDMFARQDKRGGAWMADCRTRRRLPDGSLQKPVAFLCCNFTPPVENDAGEKVDSLLTHNEVTTLFHEFGHGLHHMLTKVDVADVSGIAGVPWDVVELPSQFLENWCWFPEPLAMISKHHQTGEPLPKDLLEKMLDAKHFQSGLMMVRQLEFALFDFILHRDYSESEKTDVLAVQKQVRDQVAVIQPPEYARFSHGFTHIFAGGYSAGYYSYKWAEVLAADAFSRFDEEGIFNPETGKDYREKILEVGGSMEAMDMFVQFRGRKPSVDPLLKYSGITA